ncbi:hypothetical protein [Actinomycetospora termitidis]|uniref:Uncharacterized protein n=1 Tax=Actinomycetospora termitidis TaxID=3053470 RepID=A0ABT7MEG6_9PSEU|nr:hypothetical protein [Actinomycetospora sp. Odt1-22]MDL5159052.1 hypothetical protein [Actinomycetospora sp. Odt1-22]
MDEVMGGRGRRGVLATLVLAAILLLSLLGSAPARASDGVYGCGGTDKPGEECIEVHGDPGGGWAPSNPDSTGDPGKGGGADGGYGGGGGGGGQQSAEVRQESAALSNAVARIQKNPFPEGCTTLRDVHAASIERYSRAAVELGFADRANTLDGKSAIMGIIRTWMDVAKNAGDLGKQALDALMNNLNNDINNQKTQLSTDRVKDSWHRFEVARTAMDTAGEQYLSCTRARALGF